MPSSYTPHGGNMLDQSSLRHCRILEAQALVGGATANAPIVALVDTGVDVTHPDILLHSQGFFVDNQGNAAPPGSPIAKKNVVPGLGPVLDSHGTALAGIIAMRPDNGIGGWGIAPGSPIVPIAMAPTLPEVVIRAIESALASGARVINLSFGRDDDGAGVIGAITPILTQAATQCVIVASAGNNDGPVHFPGSHPDVIAVGAIFNDAPDDPNALRRVDRTSYGYGLSLMAPSRRIATTTIQAGPLETDVTPGYHVYQDGRTSFAAAVVSGIAALLLTRFPTLTPAQVRAVLTRTARKHVGTDYVADRVHGAHSEFWGYGLVDAYCALDFADVRIRHARGEQWLDLKACDDGVDVKISAIDAANPKQMFMNPPDANSGTVSTRTTNFAYVRVRNEGPAVARDVRIRASVVRASGGQFSIQDFRAADGNHHPLAIGLPATQIPELGAGSEWVFKLRIPAEVVTGMAANAGAHYCILAEVNAANDYAHDQERNLEFAGIVDKRNNLACRALLLDGEPPVL